MQTITYPEIGSLVREILCGNMGRNEGSQKKNYKAEIKSHQLVPKVEVM